MIYTWAYKQRWINVFAIYLRYLIGGAFTYASIVKIQGQRFIAWDGSSAHINTMPHFFETMYQSGLYWEFIGWSQLIAAFLLMTQRLAYVGALMFLPIIANIFVITVAYDFRGTPYITFLMLMANLYLVLWEVKPVTSILRIDRPVLPQLPAWTLNSYWAILGIILFVNTVLSPYMHKSIIVWFLSSVALGLAALILFFTLPQFKKLHND